MTRYSIERRTRKYVKGSVFCHLQEIYLTNTEKKKLLDTTTKTGLDTLKIASKKLVQQTAKATKLPVKLCNQNLISIQEILRK